jgi:hypothetical protein
MDSIASLFEVCKHPLIGVSFRRIELIARIRLNSEQKPTMTPTALRAGIIGLGVGKAHVRGYRLSPDVELAAVCDSNRDRLETTADEFN